MSNKKESNEQIYYLCDQKKCGDKCSAKDGYCFHTTDIKHAENFRIGDSDGKVFFEELRLEDLP